VSSDRPVPLHLGEAVSAYLDGELSALERRRAESHLAGCDVCRDELTDMMFVRARLRAMPMLELPPQLSHPAPHAGPLFRRPRVLVGAAAAAMAMILALASLAAPGDVVRLSGDEFSITFGARGSLDSNQTGRLVPLESLMFGDIDSGVNG
jgi:anti-sigma factor RsiW